ncbi:hypothetical protein GUJ93_ZPchr0007g4993 [Zizania palustris]|uniref:Alpha/beta hydrolase fold-3 domain-containing protein n=1 Tax=Zizania palustris TaxID=103762 RepID=A0A8J5W537_ZIZPA|nr:hypothetical protein GUJ93_ZPchr0007g3042 [Zizania palustris]KAG8080298.1 hypothetical protein GUJ93_ZPchr0007g4993 [Zizania palustris]
MRCDATLVESEGEDHAFHLRSPLRATSRKLMERVVQFINQSSASPPWPASVVSHCRRSPKMPKAQLLLSVPSRPYKSLFLVG